MNARDAGALGLELAALLMRGRTTRAVERLKPVLLERTPFRTLEYIGAPIGQAPPERMDGFLERIAQDRTEGGWVIIGSGLRERLNSDLEGALAASRRFIEFADVWYGADILAERVPGPALVSSFAPAMDMLASWREDPNRWIRRSVGVAAHFWAKRSRGLAAYGASAKSMLALLAPMFEERDQDAIKGVGWGVKTLGRFYPDLVAEWLAEQLIERKRHPRALMLRKSLAHLSREQRSRAIGKVS